MIILRALYFLFILVTAAVVGLLFIPQDRAPLVFEATEKPLQYATIHIDKAGFRKVLSVGSLEDCVAMQNAARSLNLDQGKENHKVECIQN